jgi:universal stress protein A
MFKPSRILVPTDFSKFSDTALKSAIDIAKQFNSKIYLLHVIDKGMQQSISDYSMSPEVMVRFKSDSFKVSHEQLEQEINRISKSKKLDVSFSIKEGTPYDVILKEQQVNKIDLIVIASHGRTGMMKHLIGSVAEKVMRGAKCPVLLVKA